MKNTKKYLSAGIVLAIALFSSVHVVAMKVRNTNLTVDQQEKIREEINYLNLVISAQFNLPATDEVLNKLDTLTKRRDAYADLLHTSKPYTSSAFTSEMNRIQKIK